MASQAIGDFSLNHLGHEFNLEPLLMCIVGGYVATNQSRNRRHFLAMLQQVGPYVFIPFFTLTGAGLNLRVFVSSFLLAFIVAVTRLVCIFVGSFLGGAMAKAPKQHNLFMGLSLITQAGVSLGLAGEISFLFTWGPSCATTMVAVILINQIVGPILCKFAIKKVNEDGKAGTAGETFLGVRKALIVGPDGYTLALASRLQKSHWKVIVAAVDDTMRQPVKVLNEQNIPQEIKHELEEEQKREENEEPANKENHDTPLPKDESKSPEEEVEELPTIGTTGHHITVSREPSCQVPTQPTNRKYRSSH